MAVQSKAIKQRIKSVKNTKKITKAMELVAASKMKRAVMKTLDARAYARYSWDILQSLEQSGEQHPLFTERAGNRYLMAVVSSNRGLCGAYNTQVLRSVVAFIKEHPDATIDFVTIGKKGDFAIRRLGTQVIATFDVGETVTLPDVFPIGELLITEFEKGSYDKVFVAYTDYISALTQTPHIKQILPFSRSSLQDTIEAMNGEVEKKESIEYLFEPGYETILGVLINKVSRMQVYHMLLEGAASEQSARMIAMKNASDAAGEMIQDLTLAFNKARQSSITQEISEISAGMASVS